MDHLSVKRYSQLKEQKAFKIEMGIPGLVTFLKKKFPQVIKQVKIATLDNKVLTIDASNWIYQFLAKARSINKSDTLSVPMDSNGNQTGHLIGMLSRVAYCMENNLKCAWVFDGAPPDEKYEEIKRRKRIKSEAQEKMEEALEEGDSADLLKISQRSISISRVQKADAQTLIELIGLPVIRSPSEAEPQCAELVKSNLAYATISEDADTLTYGCPRMLKQFNKDLKKPDSCQVLQLETILSQMKISYDQFIDFCILLGCDYTSKVKNIGPVKAYEFIREHNDIDSLLQHIAEDEKLAKRYTYDDNFNYWSAQKIFKEPEVKKYSAKDITFGKIRQAELIQFLKNKQFNDKRVNTWLARVKKTEYYKQMHGTD